MTLAVIRYLLSVAIYLPARFLAFPLALVASLSCFIQNGDDGREYLSRMWRWISTHDVQVDLYVHHPVGRSELWYLRKYSQAQVESSAWLRYVCRVYWIWRNPAYQLGHTLGYDQKGVTLSKYADGSDTWDTGLPSYSFWTATNARGQRAFLWEKQWYFYGRRCLEMQFGWKLYRDDPDERCMLAFRFNPFRAYP